MGYYSRGTFRVGTKTPTNFLYNNTSKKTSKVNYYARARHMWDDQIDWSLIKSRVASNTKGSQDEARRIKELLLTVENALTTNNSNQDLLQEEIELLQSDIASSGHANSLLSYVTAGSKWKGAVGISFEKRINNLIKMIMDTPDADYKTGGSGFRVGSPISFQASKIASKDRIAQFQLDKNGKLTADSKNALWNIVKEDVRGDYRNLIGAYQYVVQQENGVVKDVIIRQVEVDRKIDIEVPNITNFKSKCSDTVDQLRTLLSGRTFSLKNYSEWNSQAVHIGSANEFRRMSSFYYFATNSKNFADVCTFIFASNNSKDQVVHRYIGWVRILYELMGAGQLWNGRTGRLVDYIVINIYNKPGAEGLIINSTLEYIKNMPNGDPGIYFNNDNTFNTSQL